MKAGQNTRLRHDMFSGNLAANLAEFNPTELFYRTLGQDMQRDLRICRLYRLKLISGEAMIMAHYLRRPPLFLLLAALVPIKNFQSTKTIAHR